MPQSAYGIHTGRYEPCSLLSIWHFTFNDHLKDDPRWNNMSKIEEWKTLLSLISIIKKKILILLEDMEELSKIQMGEPCRYITVIKNQL